MLQHEGPQWDQHEGWKSRLSLPQLCARLSEGCGLPEFAYGAPGDSASATTRTDRLEVTIHAIPYQEHIYYHTNFEVVLRVRGDTEWFYGEFLPSWEALRDEIEERWRLLDAPRFQHEFRLRSSLQIFQFCSRLRRRFQLPKFWHDAENMNEWCITETEALLVHVSHAYRRGTYHNRNPEVCPVGCNFSVRLKVKQSAPIEWDDKWCAESWTPSWISLLARLGGGRVHYQGQWWRSSGAGMPTMP